MTAAFAWAEPLAVPAGSFDMGSTRVPDEGPVHTVSLPAYRIDRSEVSLAEFERFVAAGWDTEANWTPEGWTWSRTHTGGAGARARASGRTAEHPVVAVSWYEADAYCRAAGGRLPSESEWEHAACKPGGRYAWGDDADFDAVWYAAGKAGHVSSVATKPVTEQSPELASPFGLLHTAGNVWEWTAGVYDGRGYAVDSSTSAWRTLRGGSYMNLASYCTCTHREPARPDEARLTAGFRCAYPP
jgi:iron(II)-dependent oxidoreductase